MPRTLYRTSYVPIIPDVVVNVSSRHVSVKGPRGQMERDFKHMQCEMEIKDNDKGVKSVAVSLWYGTSLQVSKINSVCSHIRNMMTGVTKGYKYKMKSVYSHFPINLTIPSSGSTVEVRNFLGEKRVRKIVMPAGVTVKETGNKDEIEIFGNNVDDVSQTAALIHQCVLVKNKDIRKFLDGIYVSEKGNIVEE